MNKRCSHETGMLHLEGVFGGGPPFPILFLSEIYLGQRLKSLLNLTYKTKFRNYTPSRFEIREKTLKHVYVIKEL